MKVISIIVTAAAFVLAALHPASAQVKADQASAMALPNALPASLLNGVPAMVPPPMPPQILLPPAVRNARPAALPDPIAEAIAYNKNVRDLLPPNIARGIQPEDAKIGPSFTVWSFGAGWGHKRVTLAPSTEVDSLRPGWTESTHFGVVAARVNDWSVEAAPGDGPDIGRSGEFGRFEIEHGLRFTDTSVPGDGRVMRYFWIQNDGPGTLDIHGIDVAGRGFEFVRETTSLPPDHPRARGHLLPGERYGFLVRLIAEPRMHHEGYVVINSNASQEENAFPVSGIGTVTAPGTGDTHGSNRAEATLVELRSTDTSPGVLAGRFTNVRHTDVSSRGFTTATYDPDFFKIVVPEGAVGRILSMRTRSAGAGLDIAGSLFFAGHEHPDYPIRVMVGRDESESGDIAIAHHLSEPGTYYLKLEEKNSRRGDYTVEISLD